MTKPNPINTNIPASKTLGDQPIPQDFMDNEVNPSSFDDLFKDEPPVKKEQALSPAKPSTWGDDLVDDTKKVEPELIEDETEDDLTEIPEPEKDKSASTNFKRLRQVKDDLENKLKAKTASIANLKKRLRLSDADDEAAIEAAIEKREKEHEELLNDRDRYVMEVTKNDITRSPLWAEKVMTPLRSTIDDLHLLVGEAETDSILQEASTLPLSTKEGVEKYRNLIVEKARLSGISAKELNGLVKDYFKVMDTKYELEKDWKTTKKLADEDAIRRNEEERKTSISNASTSWRKSTREALLSMKGTPLETVLDDYSQVKEASEAFLTDFDQGLNDASAIDMRKIASANVLGRWMLKHQNQVLQWKKDSARLAEIQSDDIMRKRGGTGAGKSSTPDKNGRGESTYRNDEMGEFTL